MAAAAALVALAAAPPAREPEMIAIPAGCFVFGPSQGGPTGWRFRECLRAYRIDRTEATRAEYRACVAAGACPATAADGGDDLPVSGLTFDDAATYCRWRGKRLPTDTEWERAARGPRMTRFPWGDAPPTGRLATLHSDDPQVYDPTPVCSHAAGVSAEGLCDMAGNVAEWVDGWWANAVGPHPVAKPAAAAEGRRVARGGSVWDAPLFMVGWQRQFKVATEGHNVGVRCAAEEPGP